MPSTLIAPYPEQAPTPASGTLLSSVSSPAHPRPADVASAATEVALPGELPGERLAQPDVEAGADDQQRKRAIKAQLFGDAPPLRRLGRYLVLSRIGAGGMGVVYSAYDEALDRKVALKLVHTGRTGDAGGERLRREGRAMARLSHPNIAQIFEIGEHDGQVFVAMEFVAGETVTRWLRPDPEGAEAPRERGWREVLKVFVQAGRGLAAAHAQGLVHRDFKPDNVMVGADGRVRVLDFGLARALASLHAPDPEVGASESGSSLDEPLTITGAILGTPAYMSPEQFYGRRLDAKSDQFGFCVALYESLYGERPFTANTIAALVKTVETGSISAAPRGAAVPAWLRAALLRGLKAKPEERWPSMTALLAALERDRAKRWWRVGAVIVAGCVGGLGWMAATNSEIADRLGERAMHEEARADHEAERARSEAARANALARAATDAARVARDRQRLVAARELWRGDAAVAVNLLREVEAPADTPGWIEAANAALRQPIAEGVFPHDGMVWSVDVSPDGRRFVTTNGQSPGALGAFLWRVDGRAPATLLAGAGSQSRQAIFSPRGDEIAAAYDDGVIRLFETDGGAAPRLELRGHDRSVSAIVYTPDGQRLISVGVDETIRVWDRARGEQLAVFPGPAGGVWRAGVATDGRWLAVGRRDGTVLLQGLAEGGRAHVLRGRHSGAIEFLAFSPDGARLLTASRDQTARLWSVTPRGATALRELPDHSARVMAARFSPDGARLLTAALDGVVRIETVDGEGPPTVLAVDDAPVMDAVFSPDGRDVAIGTAGGDIFVRAVDGRGAIVELRGHRKKIHALKFLPDGRLLSGSFDGDARIWRVPRTPEGALINGASRRLPGLAGLLWEVEYAPGGERFAVAAASGSIHVWGGELSAPEYVLEQEGGVGQVAWGPSGARLVSAGTGGGVLLWTLEAGVPPGETRTLRERDATTLHRGPGPSPIAWSPDGARIAIGGRDHAIHIVTLGSGGAPAPAGRLEGHAQPPFRLAFSHDGARLASIAGDGAARLWTVDGGGAPLLLGGHAGNMSSVAWSPDDRRVATTDEAGVARLWSVRPRGDGGLELDGAPRVLETGAPGYVSVSFSPDGARLMTAADDGRLQVWSLSGDADALELRADATTYEAAYSPDGRWIASAGEDSLVRLWSSDGAHGPLVLEGHREGVRALAFSPDGRRLVTGGEGTSGIVWELDGLQLEVDALRRRLADATTSCLSVPQRERLLAERRAEAELARARCETRIRAAR